MNAPSQSELADLLRRYFVGATDAHATALHQLVGTVLADPAEHAAEALAFDPANGKRGYGLAWREELAFDHRRPSELELAAWLASTRPGFPAPRPYCPDIYVGRWTQRSPVRSPLARWELTLEGAFITDEPKLRSRIAWRVHRQGEAHVHDALWLDDDLQIAHKIVSVVSVTPSELVLELPGKPDQFMLDRV